MGQKTAPWLIVEQKPGRLPQLETPGSVEPPLYLQQFQLAINHKMLAYLY